MTLKKLPILYKGLHQCRRCNKFYRDAGKFSKICIDCKKPIGFHIVNDKKKNVQK